MSQRYIAFLICVCSLFTRIYTIISTSFYRDAIVTWIKKKIGPGIYNITSVEDAERILTSETKVVLGYLNSLVVSSLDFCLFYALSTLYAWIYDPWLEMEWHFLRLTSWAARVAIGYYFFRDFVLLFDRALRAMSLLLLQDWKMMSTFTKRWILKWPSFSTLKLQQNALPWYCLRRRLKNWTALVRLLLLFLLISLRFWFLILWYDIFWLDCILPSFISGTDGEFSKSAIAEFVFANKLPLVTKFTRESAPLIFESSIKKQVCSVKHAPWNGNHFETTLFVKFSSIMPLFLTHLYFSVPVDSICDFKWFRETNPHIWRVVEVF